MHSACKRLKIRGLAVLGALCILLGAIPAHADPAAAPSPPDSRFGVAQGYEHPEVMSDLNAGWERLVIPWNQIQPRGVVMMQMRVSSGWPTYS